MISLSKGNRKLEDVFLIFNLPSGLTCVGQTPLCALWCYAKKAERQYPGTLPSRMKNFEKSKKPEFIEDIISAIKSVRGKRRIFLRIHESGDFYSQEYFEKWCSAAEQMPDMTFLAYTKNYHLDLDHRPLNLRLYYSVFPDSKLETVPKEGLRAYTYGWRRRVYYDIHDSPRFENAFICDGLKCATCRVCFEQDVDIKFPFH